MVIEKETCDHQIIRKDAITGDPKVIKVECVKCGAKAEHNLITGECK